MLHERCTACFLDFWLSWKYAVGSWSRLAAMERKSAYAAQYLRRRWRGRGGEREGEIAERTTIADTQIFLFILSCGFGSKTQPLMPPRTPFPSLWLLSPFFSAFANGTNLRINLLTSPPGPHSHHCVCSPLLSAFANGNNLRINQPCFPHVRFRFGTVSGGTNRWTSSCCPST